MVKNCSIPFALPDIGEEEIAEVLDTLHSGWLTTGPKTKRFEEEFAAFIGPDVEALAVGSATHGLHLALEACGIGSGDEVITTTYTFTATAEVVRCLGGDPVFVDIDPVSFNINPDHIESAITPRTRAIIPVHFAGLACDMEAILSIARKHGLKVVEDASHALPTTCNGALVGGLASDATVYSFYATKTMTTGEGGMVVSRDPELVKRCRLTRMHGINRDPFHRYSATNSSWNYEVVAPGYKYNMTDIAASLGIHQLKKSWPFQQRRADIANRYDKAFASLPLVLPPHAKGGDTHAWHLYVIRLMDDAPLARNCFIDLMAERGISCSVHFKPLHLHSYWRDLYNFKPGDFPHAEHVYEHSVSLPLYSKMSAEDQTLVISAVKELVE
jgi:dTDP-4-amino-4,6-dideoxygalactose transaminase